ncbi:MAG: hypothetical protein IJA86_03640 [Clostridia bacterium]|nr:hypothetical protein [Clostridia bacterium]
MIFNAIVSLLKLWCQNKAKVYEAVYEKHGGVTHVGYILANELDFKLSTLIDKSFESAVELRKTIFNLIPVHYEPAVCNLKNETAEYIIEKINTGFCEYLEELLSKKESLEMPDIPYYRVIVDDEALGLIDKFRKVWRYDGTDYWFPLKRDESKENSDKFFIMFDYLEPYMKQLEQIIGLPQTHIYGCEEEDFFYPQYCTETSELIEYSGGECFYTDKNFSWAIYFSHENTVSFAGSIVPKVKALLKDEKEHWNQWEWDLD